MGTISNKSVFVPCAPVPFFNERERNDLGVLGLKDGTVWGPRGPAPPGEAGVDAGGL